MQSNFINSNCSKIFFESGSRLLELFGTWACKWLLGKHLAEVRSGEFFEFVSYFRRDVFLNTRDNYFHEAVVARGFFDIAFSILHMQLIY